MERDRLDEFMTLVVGASRSVTKIKSYYMASYGLGSTHTMCIRKLYSAPDGSTRTQLSEECELDKAQVSRIINELSEKGYVAEGTGCSNYKRKIVLTEDGKKIAAEINEIALDINEFVSGDISEKDIQTFYRVFGQICENLKNSEDNVSNVSNVLNVY